MLKNHLINIKLQFTLLVQKALAEQRRRQHGVVLRCPSAFHFLPNENTQREKHFV